MNISEKEIKKILKDDFESPSFGFSTRTMRLIKEKKCPNEVITPVKINSWVVRGIFSAFVLCFLYSFTEDPLLINYNFQFMLPKISIYWMWGLTFFGMAIGLWVWILLLEKGKVKIN